MTVSVNACPPQGGVAPAASSRTHGALEGKRAESIVTDYMTLASQHRQASDECKALQRPMPEGVLDGQSVAAWYRNDTLPEFEMLEAKYKDIKPLAERANALVVKGLEEVGNPTSRVPCGDKVGTKARTASGLHFHYVVRAALKELDRDYKTLLARQKIVEAACEPMAVSTDGTLDAKANRQRTPVVSMTLVPNAFGPKPPSYYLRTEAQVDYYQRAMMNCVTRLNRLRYDYIEPTRRLLTNAHEGCDRVFAAQQGIY